MEQRLRAGGELRWRRPGGLPSKVTLRVQADLLNGPSSRELRTAGAAKELTDKLLAADPEHARDTALGAGDKNMLRRFEVEFETRWGRLLAGRTVSKWGLGLLAQDGVAEPFDFGFRRRGTIVDRVQAAIIPAAIPGDGMWAAVFPVAIAVAADHVVEDDLANAANGDDATNVIAALVARHLHWEAGLYGVKRNQTDAQGLTIDAYIGDVFARWHDRFGGWQLEAALEALVITGETTYFRTPTNPDKLKLGQAGGVRRLTATHRWGAIRVEVGSASGDQNPYDDTVRNLKFAADYRVGLVLFHSVMRRTSAVTSANIADQRFTGQAPAGHERLATNGAVNQAQYLAPVLKIGPFKGLSLLAGAVVARSPVPLIDAYFSSVDGAPEGPLGGKASTDLGVEIDLGVRYDVKIAGVDIGARVDWGKAMLGEAFAAATGELGPAPTVLVGQLLVGGTW